MGVAPRIKGMSRPSSDSRHSRGSIAASLRALFLGSTLLIASAGPSLAFGYGTYRCGNRLVATGDSFGEVLFRCGEPDFRAASTEVVTFRLASGVEVSRIVGVETWTYDRGPRELLRFLTFRDGRLIRIAQGSYGD